MEQGPPASRPHRPPGELATERATEILAKMAAAGGGPQPVALCRLAAESADVTGAGVMLLAGGLPQASLCTTGTVSALIEELQYTLGEGPGVDAYRTGAVVAEPDLAAAATPRWPAFAPGAVAAGVRAVFGFPVRLGAARLGALHLYRDRPGSLSDEQSADASIIADVIARTVLTLQPGGEAGSGHIGMASDIHAVVHQAAGMASAQMDVGVGEALLRLRAHAFATDRPLAEVAEDVVARRLRLDLLDETR